MRANRVLFVALLCLGISGVNAYWAWMSYVDPATPATQEFVLQVAMVCLFGSFGLAQLIHWSILGGFRTIPKPRFPWRIVRVSGRSGSTGYAERPSGSDLRIGRYDSWS